jgi:hypothetical protein
VEIETARNAIIHPKSISDYQNDFQHPRFLRNYEIGLPDDGIKSTIKKLSAFADWLRRELKKRLAQGVSK